jgi:ABC-2 type transport system permease protein
MIGFTEAPELLGAGITVALAAILGAVVWRLFSMGYGLRE